MRLITLAVISFTPGIALAQTTPSPLTVEEAVALAVKQNPRLAAAAREIGAARSGVRSAQALTNPEVLFTPGLTSAGGSDEEFRLSQPLELNGTRAARTGVAQAQLRQTRGQAVVELRDVVFRTRSAYYQLSRAQELRGVAQELLRIVEEFDSATRRQVEVGTRPGIDQTQTGIEVTRARQQLTLADGQLTVAQAALNTLMGRAPAEPVTTVLPPAPAAAPAVAVAAATAEALAARAEIETEEAQRQAFLQEARLARAQGRPDLAPQLRAGSVIRGLSDAGVGVGITLPFLDYGSRRNRIRQAEASARAQEARIEAARNQVRQDVEQAIARLRAAEAVVRDYQSGVLEQARRLLEGARTGFQAGQYSVIQVLEAQRTYRAVQSEYANALADHAQARAELERATGAVPADLLPSAASGTRRPR